MDKPIVTAGDELAPAALLLVEPGDASGSAEAHAERKDLKRKTVHGALISTVAQASSLVLRTVSLMILSRLLLKEEFGLVNMVTAFTGFLGLFRDAGLSMATIQRASINKAQMSTLFWINLAVGVMLALIIAIGAPILVVLYKEPRLFWVSIAMGAIFVFNGASAQHRALLQRNLRFGALSAIDIVATLISIGVGISLALAGQGYWSLVIMTITQPGIGMVGTWLASNWIPGRPQRKTGIRSMLWFGSTITLNSVIVYLAYNVDKVLVGRFWGAESLGVYGRAYQLVNLPTENLNSTIGVVAFPALSRVQGDPVRLRSYFLKGYTLFLTLVMPITVGCALFAEDIIRVFLGAKWHDAAPIFRLMSPTILIFAAINPLAWLMLASGHAVRSLKTALLIAPVVILSYVLGLKHGAQGVAAGFSIAMVLLMVPVIAWARHGTSVTTRDIFKAILIPFTSIVVGAVVALALKGVLGQVQPTLLRLVVENCVLFGVYGFVLLFVMKQKAVYGELLRSTGLYPFRRGGD